MKDSFYGDVKPEQIQLYQHFFLRVIQAVDVANNTRWARGELYDRARLAADDEAMEAIIVGEGVQSGLSSSYLQVMVSQFFSPTRIFERRTETIGSPGCYIVRTPIPSPTDGRCGVYLKG